MPGYSAFRRFRLASMIFWLGLACCNSPALAKTTGVGDVTRRPVSFRVAEFQPLAHFGNDGIRVTYAAALGGQCSLELHPVDMHLATGDILFYWTKDRSVTPTRSKGRIELGSRIQLNMPRRYYDALVSKIDATLAQPDAPADPNAEPVVCMDGALILTERRKHGRTGWVEMSSCEDDQARFNAVPRLILATIPSLQCWLFPGDKLDACYPPELEDQARSN